VASTWRSACFSGARPSTLERSSAFKEEARATAGIQSEHLVKVVDADVAPELGGAPFLVTELLDGFDMKELLARRGRLVPADAVGVLTHAARGLEAAHACGILHRGLELRSLFLHRREDGSSVVKVGGFGLSRSGARSFMAPEQARGPFGVGVTADVWAVGLIALRLLTGERYWRAQSMAGLRTEILSEPLDPPSARWPWLPPGVDAWFARSCAREPYLRFAHVREQIARLGELVRVKK
jgi:serine/threonine protein kinase